MIHCITLPARWVPGGRIILYSAAQVAARRAARIVCWTIGIGITALPPLPAEAPPPVLLQPWPGLPSPAFLPIWGPDAYGLPDGVVIGAQPVAPIDTPEPWPLAVLAVGAVAMWRIKR
jgi:hypothetical protein